MSVHSRGGGTEARHSIHTTQHTVKAIIIDQTRIQNIDSLAAISTNLSYSHPVSRARKKVENSSLKVLKYQV